MTGAHTPARVVEAFVLEAALLLGDGVDSRAPGASVTVALCGHWDHGGPCRWPHHSAIDAEAAPARLRVVFAAAPADAPSVRERMEAALRATQDWTVVSCAQAVPSDADRILAARWARQPRG